MEQTTVVGDDERITTAIFRCISKLENVDEDDLLDSDPLYYSIDTDALERLFQDDEKSASFIRFTYHGYGITVSDNKTVTVSNTTDTESE